MLFSDFVALSATGFPPQIFWTCCYIGPQWGQVCFTAISSNRNCHHGLHCSQFSVANRVLCVRCPEGQWLGLGARSLPPFSTVLGQLSPVGLWEHKHSPGSHPCPWSTSVLGRTSTGSGAYMLVRGHQREGTCCCWPHSAMPSPCICLVLGPTGLVDSGAASGTEQWSCMPPPPHTFSQYSLTVDSLLQELASFLVYAPCPLGPTAQHDSIYTHSLTHSHIH